jgi:hypothetical protein
MPAQVIVDKAGVARFVQIVRHGHFCDDAGPTAPRSNALRPDRRRADRRNA